MLIANPIYDVFFKYLMEDTSLAKILLATIIDEEITELEIRPQETTVVIPKYYLSVIRFDFKATIKTKEGVYKKVLIELQKGKNAFDITRFRKYLGENYSKEDEIMTNSGIEIMSLPIITIYILGFKLQNLEASVIKAAHNYIDVVNNLVINEKNDFIEKLTHDCFVIQIPRLQSNLQTKLEKILQIFNQKFVFSPDHKKLVIPKNLLLDNDLQEFFERLSRPLLDETLLKQADLEEELETKLDDMSRTIEVQKQEIVATKEKLANKDAEISSKDAEINSKDAEIAALKALLSQQNNTKK